MLLISRIGAAVLSVLQSFLCIAIMTMSSGTWSQRLALRLSRTSCSVSVRVSLLRGEALYPNTDLLALDVEQAAVEDELAATLALRQPRVVDLDQAQLRLRAARCAKSSVGCWCQARIPPIVVNSSICPLA